MFMKMSDIKFNFSSKKVLVVGGSKGIGKEVCKQFKSSGAEVYCVAGTPCDIHDINSHICDISKKSEIEKILEEIHDIDFCINAAGTNLCETIENISEDEWDRVLDINLKSFYLVCKKVVEIMKRKGGGRIINIS